MSNRTSGYHQKGTQGLSEIRVQDMGHCQCWASFLSQRETVMFRECKRIVGVADLEESPRGLCKGPSIAKQAEVVGGKGLSGQRRASFQEDDELHFPQGQWHQRSGWMSHPTFPFSQPRKHISHQTKEHGAQHPLLPCAPPPTLTLLD